MQPGHRRAGDAAVAVTPGLLVHGSAQILVAEVDASDKSDLTITDQQFPMIAEVDLQAHATKIAVSERGNLCTGGGQFPEVLPR